VIFTIVLKVGLTSPRSSMLMKVRSESHLAPRASWESCRLFRSCRNTCPKALSGPKRGWICVRRLTIAPSSVFRCRTYCYRACSAFRTWPFSTGTIGRR